MLNLVKNDKIVQTKQQGNSCEVAQNSASFNSWNVDHHDLLANAK